MKAILYHSYGSPDVLKYEEVATPIPADNQVLIEVRAASLNPMDWHFMRGLPYLVRIVAGLPKPKFPGLGADVAGKVVAIGAGVTRFKPGDEVFGVARGALAEFACAAESQLSERPHNVTFEQAASAPIAALSALQSARDKGHLQSGQKVLVNGAAGGVGSFAVQIAKSFGAKVTGVCSTGNVDMLRSLGADHVIDYTREDFTTAGQHYDLLLDCVGNRSLADCKRVLNPAGICVAVGGSTDPWMLRPLARLFASAVLSRIGSQKFRSFLARPKREDLVIIGGLLQSGKVVPVIDRRYSLRDVPEAMRYLGQGHARGKIIITPP